MHLEVTPKWDKVFKKSDKVDHTKVEFHNRYGIWLAADLYKPAGIDSEFAAIAVCGPFGAVKEQCSGLYAQTLAEAGYLTIAFDPGFTGESGGQPRYMASPDINTEDYLAAVDYLTNRNDVDAERIGILGICGWGGMALNAAALDPRIKATVTSTMYNMSRVNANGYFDDGDSAEARNETRRTMAALRTAEYAAGEYSRAGGVVEEVPADAPFFIADYHDYYKTPRGYHARSLNSNGGWNTLGCQSFMNQPICAYSNEIEGAVLVVHGEKAHSCYFSRNEFARMTENSVNPDNKKLLIIPNAVHTDLYDGGENRDLIPFEKIAAFFGTHLA